jgi:hypothetical protein
MDPNVDQSAGKRSKWLAHVKKTMRANKGKSLKKVLAIAAKSYTKVKRGGSALSPQPITGGRRKTRRGARRA